jgi:succinoglycan biosynthesis transport protein ExoP
MGGSDKMNHRDEPTGGAGPGGSSNTTGKWLDNILRTGEPGPEPAVDPIARNPKDTGKGGEAVQAAEVRRRSEMSVPPTGAALFAGPGGGFHQHPQTGPSATELAASVLRFKWTILVIWILVSAPITAAVWTQIVPKYSARAEVRVRPIIPRLVFKTDDNGAIPFYDSFVNTQVSIMRSQTVLQRVLDQEEIKKTAWCRNPSRSLMERVRGTTTPDIERLRDGLSARPRPRTEIIDVSFMDPNVKDAKVIVDTVLQQYLLYTSQQSNDTEERLYRELVSQYNSLAAGIKELERSSSKLSKQLGTDTPQELVSSRRVRLDETQARLGELRNRITALKWQIQQIAVDSNGVAAAPSIRAERQSKYYEDAEWQRLDLDVKRIQHMIATGIQGPNHPGRIRSENDLKFAEDLRQQRETQLDELWQERQKDMAARSLATTADGNNPSVIVGVTTPEHQLGLVQHEEQLLRAEFEKQKADFNDVFVLAQSLERENTELRHKRELYNAVRQRVDQKDIERNVPASIEVYPAYASTRPANDRRIVFTVMGLFAGLGAGGALAFLRASRNQTIYAPRDMPQPAQTPFLGYVPLVHLRKLRKSVCDEIEQSQFLLAESVRVLRTALLSRLQGQDKTTVIVTSANEGTGKSSFTMVLGKSIAQAGRKVLIIDADLHKTSLSKRMQLLDKPGFRESLEDKAGESLCVFPTETDGLEIMPAGQQRNGPVVLEEIANGAFKSCVGRLFERHGYDIILVDTPPILPVADAIILAGQVDGTVMVEREYVSQRTEVANALVRLASAGGRLLGTVFVGAVGHDHYGYGYGYRYGYNGKKTRES